uniref:RelE toxin of RelE / RelB toxin-antitoxin system n=1 Tax=Candidatus Kentrum sp. LFY TaxID=2126342 RepID=A0A450U816_9GAMM|nr:MAG: RelE toxin of RelE / RelB toxin-antitoxin system [Candidatus Kentron sp. LFY]
MHGFAKNDKGNLNRSEERLYKAAARIILAYSDNELNRYVAFGVFNEVICSDQET